MLVDFVVFWFWARGEVKNRWSSYDDITRIELREMKIFFKITVNSLNEMIVITKLKYLKKSLLGL